MLQDLVGRFLGQDRQLERKPTKARDDDLMRGAIGLGERRAVVLELDGEVLLVDFHYGVAGRLRDLAYCLQQFPTVSHCLRLL